MPTGFMKKDDAMNPAIAGGPVGPHLDPRKNPKAADNWFGNWPSKDLLSTFGDALTGFGAGYSQHGLPGGFMGVNQSLDQSMARRKADEEKRQQQEAMQALMAGMPEGVRKVAMAFPAQTAQQATRAMFNPRRLGASDLVQVQTPQGPRYVPASQAVGKAPYQKLGQDQHSAPVKNYLYRTQLVSRFGEGSPQVRQFDDYVRARQYLDLGDRYVQPNPADPGQPVAAYGKGLGPQRVVKDGQVINMPAMPAPNAFGNLPQGVQQAATGQPQPQGVSVQSLPEAPQKAKDREALSGNLADMASAYLTLRDLGGVVDPDAGTLDNLGARLSSSGIGQAIGSAVGTEESSVRKRILNMRPALINSIRQATGMSAKGMDSNVELQFFLQQATDPEGDLLSNLAAIDALDQSYGLGNVLERSLPPEVFARVRGQAQTMMQGAPKAELPARARDIPADDIKAEMARRGFLP